jgi:transcriptional regulator with XRE-family HTH domain
MHHFTFMLMGDNSLAKRVGRLVRRLRTDAGLSQEQFASICELHRTYVGAIERGEKTITVETANKLAKALGLSLSQFFQQIDEEDIHHE